MLTATPEFKSTYAYDPDGNILSLTRNGSVKVGSPPGASILMDSLTYTYGNGYGGYSLNQLKCLNEDAPDLYANDIKYQHACDTAPPNYVYDPIGNTTMDLVSGQSDIKWNIYNKVVETINATDSVIMRFKYDGAGNRIAKYFMQRIGTDTNCKSDYYVRDAQGNILATYRDDFQYDGSGALLSRKYHLAGHDIYGSSRLGVKNYWPSQHRWLWDNTMSEYDSLTINQRQPWYSLEYQDIIQKDSLDVYGSTHNGIWKSVGITGQKQYEITDHLGNVLSTVSDGRGSNAPHTSTDSFTITGYEPAIKSITDYYPFGMQMPDRCYSDGTTHVTNISAVTTVPVHHMVNRVWPDVGATSIGGAIILTGSSPLGLVASGLEALSYELPRYIGGLLHTVRIFTHGTVPPGFRAEISMGGTSSSTTSFSGISTDLTYTPTSIIVPYLHIYNLGMRDTIFIDSVHIDSATYEPYHVLSSISSSDGYAYGFNGQMKVNEWAGRGNHNTALFWEYDVRTGRRGNRDPIYKPSVSRYATFNDNPIANNDVLGNYSRLGALWRNSVYGGKGTSYVSSADQWGYEKGENGGVTFKDGRKEHAEAEVRASYIPNKNNPSEFRAYQQYGFEIPGEKPIDRYMRWAGAAVHESKTDFVSSLSYGGYGAVENMVVSEEIVMVEGANAGGTQVLVNTTHTGLVHYYPANNGALGQIEELYLMPGLEIDRFGNPDGRFFSPRNTPYEMRARPPNSNMTYNAYRVLKPFPVQSSTISPAFGQFGYGKQFVSPVECSVLIRKGFIIPIN